MPEAQGGNAAPTPKLALTDIRSGYGAIDIVDGTGLSVAPGEIFALMGKNGMGKSTLLKTILGFIPLRGGAMEMDGASIVGASPSSLIAAGVAYAPQEQALFQDLSIRDNLRLALRSDSRLSEALDRLFTHFPLFKDRLSQKAGTLSGGEQKMLITGRALMLQPTLLLLDEISEGLQPSVVERIASALELERRLNRTTILMIEQNLDFALGLADTWAVLKRGKIDDAGSVGTDSRDRVLEHLKI